MAWLLEFRLLGPVEAVIDGRPVALLAAKPRAFWPSYCSIETASFPSGGWSKTCGAPPETATKALQGYVSQLRKALGADRLLTKPPGYSLRVEEGEASVSDPLSDPIPQSGLALATPTADRARSTALQQSAEGAKHAWKS